MKPSPDHVLAQIERAFREHDLSAADAVKMIGLRDAVKALSIQIAQAMPAGREQSLALTRLEEALFWANAGIARAASEELAP